MFDLLRMLEKDENKRFDINKVDVEMKRINFVSNKQELDKKLLEKESVIITFMKEGYTFNNRYIIERVIGEGSESISFLVHDMHDDHNKFAEK